jgi:hypothetical protein
MKPIKTISNLVQALLWMFLFHSSAFAVVTDSNVILQETNISKPAYLESYVDPAFKTKITRIAGDPYMYQGGVMWGDEARHHYSKDQAWNADMSLLYIRNNESARHLILDGSSYVFKFELDFRPNEIRWSPVDASYFLYTKGNKFYKYNVYSKVHTLIREFSEYKDKKYALNLLREGNVAVDGSKIAFSSKSKAGGYEVYAYDIKNNRKSKVLNVGSSKPKWVSISASGRFVVVFWSDKKSLIYNSSDMSYVGRLPYNLSHYDLAIDVDGRDVAVGVEKPGAGGRVIKQRLSDGEMTVLIEKGYAAHTSTRNINRPGWAYVSYHTENSDDRKRKYSPFYSEVIAVKMDGSGEVERLGHFRNDKVDYKTEPHASPSPDGTKIIFASDWNNLNARPVQSYVIETGSESQNGNLIKNSDFESGFASWSQNQPVEITLDESGNNVAKMGGSGGSAGLYQYLKASGSNDVYSFSMKYKFAGRSCAVYIDFYNDKTRVSKAKIVLPYVATETLISGDIPAPAVYNRIRVYIYKGTSGSATIYADDVKLMK